MSIYTTKQLASTLHLKDSLLQDLARRSESCYRPYPKKKRRKNGIIKKRIIDNPNEEIKSVQKIINRIILKPAIKSLPLYMHGARPGKNIRTCAETHVGQSALLTLDIEDCFPSIKASMVYSLFRTYFGYSKPVASILTQLTTYRGHLPQGSPTSSSLCNLILKPLVTKLHNLCISQDVNFSQFMDDFYLSGHPASLLKIKKNAVLHITKYRFKINQAKDHITTRIKQMKLGNTIINKKISIGHSKKHAIERAIMQLTKNDLADYELKNREIQSAQRKHHKIPKCKTKIHILKGQIASASAVNPEQGRSLQRKLIKKLNSLQ